MKGSVFRLLMKIVLLIAWGCGLFAVSRHKGAFAVLLLMGAIATAVNHVKKTESRFISLTGFVSLAFAGSNVLMLTVPLKELFNGFIHVSAISYVSAAALTAAASFVLLFELIVCLSNNISVKANEPPEERWSKGLCLITFAVIAVTYTSVLFLCKYPGSIDPDYKGVMDQIYGLEPITNHHPYYYTMFIKAVLKAGTFIFKDVNAAVAVISVIQILFVAFIEARAVKFLYDIGTKKWLVLACFFGFLLNPVNIFYSFSVWKDTYFALLIMAACIIVAKIINGMYKEGFLPYLLLSLSLIGTALIRSNGLFVLAIWFAALLIVLRKKNVGVKIAFLAALVLGFFFKNIVLNMLSVPQPDILESLSIPMQQISMVLHNGDVSPEQAEVLSKLADIEDVRAAYDPCWVDFVKKVIRDSGNLQYLNDNKMLFLKTYIGIGIKHPADYIKAWLYQTQGYWSLKDSFSLWYDGIEPNAHGFLRTVNSEAVGAAVDGYASLFVKILHFFTYISVYTWTCIIACTVAVNKKNPTGIILSVPAIALFLTLLIAVPLDAAFRYAYAYIYTAPVILAVSMLMPQKKEIR